MAGTALRRRLTWQLAELVEVDAETPRVKTIVFDVPDWPGHRAGQHVDVRLTAEDGYQGERSYSIASAPDGTRVALTVQRLEDGGPDSSAVGRRGDRVASFRLIAVLGRQPNVDVLAGAVAAPAGDVEDDRLDAGCLGDGLDELCELPGQSPA